MRIEQLEYELPPELIAQHPIDPRDASRLLVLDRATGAIDHRIFRDIGDFLQPGDLLVLNDTRVVPARYFARRDSGGRVEGLFLHTESGAPVAAGGTSAWRTLLKPSARLRAGERLALEGADATLSLVARHERGEWTVASDPPLPVLKLLLRIGQTPLPPYIRRDAPDSATRSEADEQRYQTVYAAVSGAVAAPTAGLHFTRELLERLDAVGVRRATVTLHVGPGTFMPIDVDDLAQHRMHAEWYELSAETAGRIIETRAAGGRIVAVGTTTARVLETAARDAGAEALAACSGWTDIFIFPPYPFHLVDRLITNFHLPRSTLLAMLMAFAGEDAIQAAYRTAVAERYRFYSYGDAMLIV